MREDGGTKKGSMEGEGGSDGGAQSITGSSRNFFTIIIFIHNFEIKAEKNRTSLFRANYKDTLENTNND